MITPREARRQKLVSMIAANKLDPYKIAPVMGITVPTLYNWTSGRSTSPPYAVWCLCAAIFGAQPASKEETLENWKALGVGQTVASYWRKSKQIPRPARMAMTWYKMKVKTES